MLVFPFLHTRDPRGPGALQPDQQTTKVRMSDVPHQQPENVAPFPRQLLIKNLNSKGEENYNIQCPMKNAKTRNTRFTSTLASYKVLVHTSTT